MFTLTDICNIAIQIEQNGAETYFNASKTAENSELAKVLAWMAEEEKKHARWFKSIQSDKELTAEQMEMEAVGKSLLLEMVKNNTFSLDSKALKDTTDLKELIAQSIEFEQDTILFYEILLDFLDDTETIEKLKTIIGEEHNHIKTLKTLAEQKEFL
ncbi:MAG: ferritin family protein [Desulfobulbaceae bacterium]|nr:ferritin family protein [Desulfobulbaceae bacterium]